MNSNGTNRSSRLRSSNFRFRLYRGFWLCFSLGVFLTPWGLKAEQPVQVSVTAGAEGLQGQSPVYDLNLIFFDAQGLRFELLPQYRLYQGAPYLKDGELRINRIEGDVAALGWLKAWDFRRYGPRDNLPLSFLTAYTTLGVSSSGLTLRQTRYQSVGGRIEAREVTESLSPTQGLVQMGLYGGDSFAVVDLRLGYLFGTVRGDLLEKQLFLSNWSLVLALGVGF